MKFSPIELYIACCTEAGGVYRYRIAEGEPPQQLAFTPMDRPMYLAEEGGTLYALLRAPFGNEESGLAVYTEGGADTLSPVGELCSTRGVVACHLTVLEGVVYAVNYLSGNVIRMPDRVVTHSGQGPHPTRQTAPHTHYISPSPDQKYLFAVDLGLDRVFVYDKELNPVSSLQMPAGQGPRHLAFHADGTHVFCANELGSTVSVLRYREGALALESTVSALPADFTGENTSAAIRCVGDTVYVSNRGDDSVAVLRFDGERLLWQKHLPTYGSSPRDIWVHQGLLIAANENSDAVTLIDTESGALLDTLALPAPLCLLEVRK